MSGSIFACAAVVGGLCVLPNSPVRALAGQLGIAGDRDRMITVPVIRAPGLGKFEPEHGCFIGAYVLRDINISGSMERWEELTGKQHASYLRYVGYGLPFPKDWVQQVRSLGAVPNIALEPNSGLDKVVDDAYLHDFARDAAESGGPVFLRFASEMNGNWTAYSGDSKGYREKFRLVAEVMHREAPNVAMVWTTYCQPQSHIPDFYPGDDVVDWVGINVYSVHHHDGDISRPADGEDPAELIRKIYGIYSERKPIQLSEFAATHYCRVCHKYVRDFAVAKMTRLYHALQTDFHRIKMVYWFSFDTREIGSFKNNDYAVTDDPVVRDTYRKLIRDPYFLPRIREGEYYAFRKEPTP